MLKIKRNKSKIEIARRKNGKRFTSDFWKGLLIATAFHLLFVVLFQVVARPKEEFNYLPFTKVVAEPINLAQNTNIKQHALLPSPEPNTEPSILAKPEVSFPSHHIAFPEPDFSDVEKIEYHTFKEDDD